MCRLCLVAELALGGSVTNRATPSSLFLQRPGGARANQPKVL